MKKVAVISDLTGFGRCALSVALPVISALGVQACSVPTAVLSTHPMYRGYYFYDMTPNLSAFLNHWNKTGLSFDAILSGYMCCVKQIEIVQSFIIEEKNKKNSPVVIIDPVMGDNGKTYEIITDDMISSMRRLLEYADYILPNLTEAFLLADLPYTEELDEQIFEELVFRLSTMTDGMIIIKSIPGNGVEKMNILFENKGVFENNFIKLMKWPFDTVSQNYPGCGDLFASIFTGKLLAQLEPKDAFLFACRKTTEVVKHTFMQKSPSAEGLMFEEINLRECDYDK